MTFNPLAEKGCGRPTAPTRRHPGVESPEANLLAGPIAAVMDRTRDLIRDAMPKTETDSMTNDEGGARGG